MGLENSIGEQTAFLRGSVAIVDVAPVIDTSIYAAGDVLFDTVIAASAVPVAGGSSVLRSVELLDEDDQGIALDLVFFDSLVPLGTVNAAPNISDANARKALGCVSIATGDYIDLGGCRVATLRNIGLVLKAAAGATDLYVAAITRGGTPTYTASGLKLKLGFG